MVRRFAHIYAELRRAAEMEKIRSILAQALTLSHFLGRVGFEWTNQKQEPWMDEHKSIELI